MGRRSPDPEAAPSSKTRRSRSPGKPRALLNHVLALPGLLHKRVNRLTWPLRISVYLGFIYFLYLCYSRHARLNLLYNLTGFGQNHEDTNVNWPPRYENIREWQRELPQHNLSLPYPEGESGRYVKFSSQIRGLGWNNVFNELLLLTWLAQRSNRAYVFEDYTWKQGYYPWYRIKAWEVPSRTPLPALIAGPTAGGPWEAGDPSPRSVHEDYWTKVCPKSKTRVILVNDMKKKHDLYEKNATQVFEAWRSELADDGHQCIDVQGPKQKVEDYAQVFDLWLWGSERILDIWEEFRDSPVSRLLKTSPVVEGAVKRNQRLFVTPALARGEDPFDRVFAVHIRRGDFKKACQSLADWKSSFYSWNQLPWLPDRFPYLPGGEHLWGSNTPENVAKYFERCLPDRDRIVDKINGAREDYEKEVFGKPLVKHHVNVLFILTNDRSPWLEDLKEELRRYDWKIVTSHQLVFKTAQEQDVSMAIDMDLARQAAIFLGNGWSSFTSNILHRRLVDKKIPLANRFF